MDEVNWDEATQDTTTIKYVPVQVRPMVASHNATEETGPNTCARGSSSSPMIGCSSTLLPSDSMSTNNTSLTKTTRTQKAG